MQVYGKITERTPLTVKEGNTNGKNWTLYVASLIIGDQKVGLSDFDKPRAEHLSEQLAEGAAIECTAIEQGQFINIDLSSPILINGEDINVDPAKPRPQTAPKNTPSLDALREAVEAGPPDPKEVAETAIQVTKTLYQGANAAERKHRIDVFTALMEAEKSIYISRFIQHSRQLNKGRQ